MVEFLRAFLRGDKCELLVMGRYLFVSVVALLLALLALRSCRHEIVCRLDCDEPSGFPVYYATERNTQLCESQKVKLDESGICRVPCDTVRIRIDLPKAKALDLGAPKILIGGNPADPSKISATNIGVWRTYLISDRDLFRQASESADVGVVIVYLFLVLILVDLVVRASFAFPDWSFIVFVLLTLLFPALNISRESVDLTENRSLQQFPELAEFDNSNPSAFFKKVELAYGDRFNGRKTMVRLRDGVRWFFDRVGNGLAFVGVDGWLFLNGTLPDRRMGPLADYDGIEKYLDSIDKYAKKRGKKFVLLVAPDKSRVYEDKLGVFVDSYLEKGTRAYSDMVISQLCSKCTFPIVYPRAELKQLRTKYPCDLYWKHDTHWNWQGTYLGGYLPVMRAMGKEDYCDIEKWIDKASHVRDFDLAKSFAYIPADDFAPQICKVPVFKAGNDPSIKVLDKNKSGQPAVIDTSSTNAKGRLFCLRDSFMQVGVPYFARSFEKCRFVWRQQIEASDQEWLEQTDVIFLEIVERDLSRLGVYKLPKELN